MTQTSDEIQIRQIIENWAKAVRNKNIDAILSHHSDDFVMYDVPPPFRSVGLDAYRKTWDIFFSGTELGTFDITELNIIAGDDVAFCYATMFCMNKNNDGIYERLDFRLTMGLKKIDKSWTILHEHHSIPAID
jgi:ketosteroid isomerase-like protein